MMLDEPYRWAEAVANRREYIEDQLASGSPIVGAGYSGGALVLTLGQGQQKLYEIYDRIAMGALGHPTDIEKLRQAAVDLAHVIGFNYSDADVTLQQIVHFGLGPEVKRAFDEIFRSPYIARVLLAEISPQDGASAFYTVDYDGQFRRTPDRCAVGGSESADRDMQRFLDAAEPGELSLDGALDLSLKAWAVGRLALGRGDGADDTGEERGEADEGKVAEALSRAFETLTLEAIVLETTPEGGARYRSMADEEAAAATAPYTGQQ